jgi:hypothetical protein
VVAAARVTVALGVPAALGPACALPRPVPEVLHPATTGPWSDLQQCVDKVCTLATLHRCISAPIPLENWFLGSPFLDLTGERQYPNNAIADLT